MQHVTMAPPHCSWRSALLTHNPQVASISPLQSALVACETSSLQLTPRLHASNCTESQETSWPLITFFKLVQRVRARLQH